MHIADAQRDVRTTFLGGFAGQLVSGALWLGSAALATWGSTQGAILLLVIGGFFIFPTTQLLLRLLGRPAGLPRGHPMNALGMQVAFTLPLTLPIVGAAAMHRLDWFYPAFMIALGAHYLPFVFLYGMWQFGALAAVLAGAGMALAFVAMPLATGAWLTGLVLLAFAWVGRRVALAEGQAPAPELRAVRS